MKHKKSRIFIAFMTLITVIVWVAMSVMRTYQTSTITPDVSQIITPLDPNVKEEVFQKLQLRQR